MKAAVRRYAIIAAGLVALAGVIAWLLLTQSHPNTLRHIALEQCVPNEQRHHSPAPCARVSLASGFVALKDRNGPLQYLLMPTFRLNGMESPLLLSADTPNYFWLAWQARELMSERRGAPVPDSVVSLAINSRLGRTQNHLHIHISCLRQDVREKLNRSAVGPGSGWLPLAGGFNGHEYLMRRVSVQELARRSPFMMLAEEIPAAKAHMGRYALALAQLPDGNFILLATRRNLLKLNLASAEELQDHDCALLAGR